MEGNTLVYVPVAATCALCELLSTNFCNDNISEKYTDQNFGLLCSPCFSLCGGNIKAHRDVILKMSQYILNIKYNYNIPPKIVKKITPGGIIAPLLIILSEIA